MKWVGIFAVVGGLAGFGLYYGGFVDGSVEAQPTAKAKTTFNKGVEAAVRGVQNLKVDESSGDTE